MLRPFRIHQPATVAEASAMLAVYGDGAALYAGGTELIPIMKEGLTPVDHLIDLKTIDGLDAITAAGGILSIGALATHRQIERSPDVRRHAPLLSRVASQVANPRVRHAGTLGGNLCFAEPHSDPAPVLLAAGAELVLVRAAAERRVSIESFYTGILQTVRLSDEVLVRVDVPATAPGAGGAYERFATHERPMAGVAVMLEIGAGVITQARIAIGSVGPVPARAPDAESLLAGARPDRVLFAQAAQEASGEAEILNDTYGSDDYKRQIVAVLAARALMAAAAEAGSPVA
jgi:carbon-monoxide dehydrogenase medium subunit